MRYNEYFSAKTEDGRQVHVDSTGTHWLYFPTSWNTRRIRPFTVAERDCFKETGKIPMWEWDTYATKEEEVRMTEVSKSLSMCFLVASDAFAKLPPAKQTEVLAGVSGKPLIFVESFNSLRDTRKLLDRLLKGEDVAMELEFNDITISDDEKKALDGFRPVLERLQALKPPYTWYAEHNMMHWRLETNSVRNPAGYQMSKAQAKKVWDAASKYWGGGPKPDAFHITIDYSQHKVSIGKETVAIGCQRHDRAQIEGVARHYNWEPNV